MIGDERLNILYERVSEHYFTYKSPFSYRLKRGGVLRYLFRERARIITWNRGRQLLKTPFFRVEVNRKFGEGLKEIYVKGVKPLTKYLRQILKESWKWKEVSVFNYNLIVLLFDLVNRFEEFSRLKEFNRTAFLTLIQAYSRLVANDSYLQRLFTTVESLFQNHRLKSINDLEKVHAAIERLQGYLTPETGKNTLLDYIQAYYIMEKRGFVERNEFIRGETAVLQTSFYHCDKAVLKSIVSYLLMVDEKIRLLQKEYGLSSYLESFAGEQNGELSPQLAAFYETVEGDVSNYFPWAITLLKRVGAELESFVTEHWDIMDRNEEIVSLKMINEPWIVESYQIFDELLNAVLSRYRSLVIPVIDGEEVFNGGEGLALIKADSNLEALYELIQEALAELKLLGFKLKEALEDNLDRDSINYFFLNYMIVKPDKWRGEQAAKVFEYHIEIIFRLCFTLKEQELLVRVEGKERQEKQLNSYIEMKQRLLDSNGLIEELLKSEGDKNRSIS